MKDKNLQYYISGFLTTYLGGERGLSENTFISYNYTFQLLIPFFHDQVKKPINKVKMEEFTADNIKAFLASLEEKGCSVSTRNQRLAAIKSFCRYVQSDSPQNLYNMQQILAIPSKKKEQPVIQYLTAEQLGRLLAKPDSSNKYGFKDLLILTLLSDTGVRVSELVNIRVSDVRLGTPAQILVHGKGNKNRYVPISSNAAKLLSLYFDNEGLRNPAQMERFLFLNRSGRQFTRAGITYILQKYTSELHEENPTGFPERLTPHCLRHTKAMLMLQAGQNLIYIRDQLGHEHIKTTEVYARIDSKQRQDALKAANEQIKVPDPAPIEYKNNPSLLDWLNKYCE